MIKQATEIVMGDAWDHAIVTAYQPGLIASLRNNPRAIEQGAAPEVAEQGKFAISHHWQGRG